MLERQLNDMPALRMKIEDLERENGALTRLAEELEATQSSFSWRITRPLREGKKTLEGLLARRS